MHLIFYERSSVFTCSQLSLTSHRKAANFAVVKSRTMHSVLCIKQGKALVLTNLNRLSL